MGKKERLYEDSQIKGHVIYSEFNKFVDQNHNQIV